MFDTNAGPMQMARIQSEPCAGSGAVVLATPADVSVLYCFTPNLDVIYNMYNIMRRPGPGLHADYASHENLLMISGILVPCCEIHNTMIRADPK